MGIFTVGLFVATVISFLFLAALCILSEKAGINPRIPERLCPLAMFFVNASTLPPDENGIPISPVD